MCKDNYVGVKEKFTTLKGTARPERVKYATYTNIGAKICSFVRFAETK